MRRELRSRAIASVEREDQLSRTVAIARPARRARADRKASSRRRGAPRSGRSRTRAPRALRGPRGDVRISGAPSSPARSDITSACTGAEARGEALAGGAAGDRRSWRDRASEPGDRAGIDRERRDRERADRFGVLSRGDDERSLSSRSARTIAADTRGPSAIGPAPARGASRRRRWTSARASSSSPSNRCPHPVTSTHTTSRASSIDAVRPNESAASATAWRTPRTASSVTTRTRRSAHFARAEAIVSPRRIPQRARLGGDFVEAGAAEEGALVFHRAAGARNDDGDLPRFGRQRKPGSSTAHAPARSARRQVHRRDSHGSSGLSVRPGRVRSGTVLASPLLPRRSFATRSAIDSGARAISSRSATGQGTARGGSRR